MLLPRYRHRSDCSRHDPTIRARHVSDRSATDGGGGVCPQGERRVVFIRAVVCTDIRRNRLVACSWNVARFATFTAPAVSAIASPFCTCSVPALTLVTPACSCSCRRGSTCQFRFWSGQTGPERCSSVPGWRCRHINRSIGEQIHRPGHGVGAGRRREQRRRSSPATQGEVMPPVTTSVVPASTCVFEAELTAICRFRRM